MRISGRYSPDPGADLGQTTAEYAMLLAGLLTVVVLFVALIKTGVLGDVVAALRERLLELINSQ